MPSATVAAVWMPAGDAQRRRLTSNEAWLRELTCQSIFGKKMVWCPAGHSAQHRVQAGEAVDVDRWLRRCRSAGRGWSAGCRPRRRWCWERLPRCSTADFTGGQGGIGQGKEAGGSCWRLRQPGKLRWKPSPAKKKKSLSLMMGPPMAPPYCLRTSVGLKFCETKGPPGVNCTSARGEGVGRAPVGVAIGEIELRRGTGCRRSW